MSGIEIAIIAVVFALGVLPAATCWQGTLGSVEDLWDSLLRGRWQVGLFGLGLVVVGLLLASSLAGMTRPSGVDLSALRPAETSKNGYHSSKSCQACHPDHHHSWHRSYHRTMTQPANQQTVVGDFDDVAISGYGWDYLLQKENGQFVVQMDPRLGTPSTRRVVMTTGSHHMQDVWVETDQGNQVELVQCVFLFDEQRWVPREKVFLRPPRAPGGRRDTWSRACSRCHSTAPIPQVRTQHTEVAELGISCEACHGPAQQHAQCNTNPLRRYQLHLFGGGDRTIVHPGRLSPRRSSQICGFCHSHSFHEEPSESQRSGLFFPDEGSQYRPGDELDETVAIDTVDRDPTQAYEATMARFWPDGMVRGSGREYTDLVQSPCFQGGHQSHQMGCLSCHSMHKEPHDSRPLDQWANDQLKVGMDGNQGCLQCHAIPDIQQHTHHLPQSSGSQCYNCHMPHTNYGLLKAIRAHLNTNPNVTTTLETGRPNACNLCHLDQTLQWTAEHLFRWYGQPRPRLSAEQQSTSAAVLGLLRGDAHQRILIAWHLGWKPAREVSGDRWMAPYLGELLDDPYAVVRAVAWKSLKKLPNFDDLPFDWVPEPSGRSLMAPQVRARWEKLFPASERQAIEPLLIGPEGTLQLEKLRHLLQGRNRRPTVVEE